MGLTARAVAAGYGKRLVLRNLSCEVAQGKLTVIIGPNGSGKSTLLRCLARALKPSHGQVLLDGHDLYDLAPSRVARQVAYVAQANPMRFAFTVRELVGLGGGISGMGAASPADRVTQALRTLDMEIFADRSLLTLSGGEQQRAAVARGLAQPATYLLLDEPTAHLDLRHQVRLLHALQQTAHEQDRAVLVVLHDLNLAAQFADTLLLLQEGEAVAEGSPAEVLTPERIFSVYQTYVHIQPHPATGQPWVQALPDSPAGRSFP